MSEWQPIETAPYRHGRLVLVFCEKWGGGQVQIASWDEDEQAFRVQGYSCRASQPSHWMPLPEAPDERG
jgi:hypothetical protein